MEHLECGMHKLLYPGRFGIKTSLMTREDRGVGIDALGCTSESASPASRQSDLSFDAAAPLQYCST